MWEKLIDAIQNNDIEEAKVLISQMDTEELDQTNSKNETALHLAIMKKIPEVCKLLITKMSDQAINTKDNSPIQNHTYSNVNRTTYSTKPRDNINIGNKNFPTILPVFDETDNREPQVQNSFKAVKFAIQKNMPEAPKILVAKKGYTPLDLAIRFLPEICELLIPRMSDAAINAVDPHGYTPLQLAISKKLSEICELLIPRMSDAAINAVRKDGNTALNYAFIYCHGTTLPALLIKKGVNINDKALKKIIDQNLIEEFKEGLKKGAKLLIKHPDDFINNKILSVEDAQILKEKYTLFNNWSEASLLIKSVCQLDLDQVKDKMHILTQIPADQLIELANSLILNHLMKVGIERYYDSNFAKVCEYLPEELKTGMISCLNDLIYKSYCDLLLLEAALLEHYEDISPVPFSLSSKYTEFQQTPEVAKLDKFYATNPKYKEVGTYLLEMLYEFTRITDDQGIEHKMSKLDYAMLQNPAIKALATKLLADPLPGYLRGELSADFEKFNFFIKELDVEIIGGENADANFVGQQFDNSASL
jgi:hypothetical protein